MPDAADEVPAGPKLRRPPNVGGLVNRFSDVLLAALVVGVVAMMIIPLPTWLLDIFITLNISIAVILILVAIYITDALKISTFPTILLVTTLFRLALEVSATRLILIQANAGEVIKAFGQFVVAGNYVVGGVVFLILIVVNFMVIAKGSERVSEVAARFTLDAMPGKQMAIDADLRAGAYDLDEARRRRRALERESQLYGAMDGAMKFVKGDAIAGIIIAGVNIIGGLVIGVLQRGMPVGEAAKVYTVLTIGDGLVAQIPALLISTAAGLIITRVNPEDEGSNLGKDIGQQVLAQPKALLIAGGLLFGLGIVPGMPTVPFLILAFAVGFAGWSLRKEKKDDAAALAESEAPPESIEPGPKPPVDPASEVFVPVVTPIVLEVSDSLVPFVDSRQDGGRFLHELVPFMRDGLFVELGVRFPGVRARGNPSLPPGGYQVQINEVPVVAGQVVLDHVLVNESADRLRLLNMQGQPAMNPATRQAAAWVPNDKKALCEEAGLVTWDASGFLTLHLTAILRRHAREFLGVQEVQNMLEQLEQAFPALVKEVVPKVIPPLKLTEILGRLVEEGISVRDLRAVLQALAEWGQVEADPVMLTEHVRSALRRYISHKYTLGMGTLVVYLLDPHIEETVRGSIKHTPAGSHLSLEPEVAQDILFAVRQEVGQLPPTAQQPPVILTAMDIRRFVRKLVEHEFPALAVLSYQELSPDINVQPVARITLQ
jgi:type III secretion protein V